MVPLVDIIVGGVIVYGLATMLAHYDGPFNIFDTLRLKTFETFGEHWITEGIHCPVCLGFWLSIPVSILLGSGIITVVIIWLSIMGLNTFMVSLLNALEGEE